MPFTIIEVSDFAKFESKVETLVKKGKKRIVILFQEESDGAMSMSVGVAKNTCITLDGEILLVKIHSEDWANPKNPFKAYKKIPLKKLPVGVVYCKKIEKEMKGEKLRDNFIQLLILCAKLNGQQVDKRSLIMASQSKRSLKSQTGMETPKKGKKSPKPSRKRKLSTLDTTKLTPRTSGSILGLNAPSTIEPNKPMPNPKK